MTQLWLGNTTESGLSVGSYAERKLMTAVGTGVGSSASTTPTAGGDHIEATLFGTPAIWLFRVAGPLTISGTVSFEICGLENAMTDNVQPGVRVVRIDNSGTILSEVVANANAGHVPGSEYGTTVAKKSWTATPTSTAFSDGDWIGIIVHGDAIGTMAAGSAVGSPQFAGSLANTADSNVTFTETIGAYVATSALPERPFVIYQAVPRAATR